MYNEGKNNFVRDAIVKILLVLLFVFLLIWLFPMPNLNPFYDRIFADNIKSMKEVAKNYYTLERLPKNIGDKEKITLQEMIDKKMIIPFIDKDGNSCDTTNSYVEVVKMDTEYLFKTYLSCPSKTDYVVDYFGCYDICKDNSCKCTNTATEYQFKRTTNKKALDHYVCPVGFILDGSSCVKTRDTTDTKPAVISCKSGYTYNESNNKCEKLIVDEIEAKLTCSDGFVYDSNSKKCLKSTGESINADPTCIPYLGYEYNIATKKCEKPIMDEKDAELTCSSYPGYSLNPTSKKCEKLVKDEKNAEQTSCSAYSGYNYNPTSKKCEKSSSTPMCSSGYTYSSGKCTKSDVKPWGGQYSQVCDVKIYTSPQPPITTETFTRTFIKKYVCESGCSGSGCDNFCYSYKECNNTRTCSSPYSYYSSDKTCRYTFTSTPHSCSGTISGQYCITTDQKIPGYTCASYPGYTLSETKCYMNTPVQNPPGYTCASYSRYTLNGTKCNKLTIDQKTPGYTCASHSGYTYNSSNNKCEKTTNEEKNPVYVCENGTLNKTKCRISQTDRLDTYYGCPDSYVLDNKVCYKTTKTDERKNAEAIYKNVSKLEYTWSRNKTLAGWTPTGKTRTIEVACE